MEGEDNVWEDRKGASQVLSVFYFFTWEIRSRNKMFIGYKRLNFTSSCTFLNLYYILHVLKKDLF